METVPEQPTAKAPIKKTMPIVLVLLGAVLLIGISTAYNAMTGASRKKDAAAKSTLQTKPATADPQQVTGFEKQQQLLAKNDQEQAQLQQAIAALQAQDRNIPAPEADPSMPMTAAQAQAIYGNSANGPQQTSSQAEARAQAKQQAAERETKRLDALNSETVAVDFQTHESSEPTVHVIGPAGGSPLPPSTSTTKVLGESEAGKDLAEEEEPQQGSKKDKNPMGAYDFDT